MPDASTHNQQRRPGRRTAIVLATLLTIAVICCLGLPYTISRAIRTQLEAETRLHATITTARAINTFALAQDPPRWPTSWDELATVEYTEWSLAWPADRAQIEQHISIDFTTTLDAALATPEHAIAYIRPRGPCDAAWQSHVWHALEPARTTTTP